MAEHAIAIARVSHRLQDEEDQRPGLVAYSDRKGYALDEVVAVHGRSAFHGRHVKAILAAVDKHVRKGVATVVIFRHVDRSSREGVFKGIDLLNKIMSAGARIEFSEQEFLNNNPGWIGPLLELAKEESKIKSDRKLQGNAKRRAAGELIGRIPWGYDPVLRYDPVARRDVQVNITPNALGKKWIPLIFAAAIAGKSVVAIAEMLKGVPSPQKNGLWHPDTVRRLITRTTYYGQMPNNPFMKYEPLITFEIYQQANIALQGRVRRGRGAAKLEPVFLYPYCGACWRKERAGAPSGKSPMYRIGTGKHGIRYYSCKGHGPGRKSCGGPGVPLEELDAAIDHAMAANAAPHLVPEYTAGDDNAEKRDVINQKIKAAQEASDYLLVAQLAQEAMEIGPTERKGELTLKDSGIKIGDYWKTLTPAEKRDELATWLVVTGMNAGKLWAVLDKPSPDGLGSVLVIGDPPSKSLLERAKADGIMPESHADELDEI